MCLTFGSSSPIIAISTFHPNAFPIVAVHLPKGFVFALWNLRCVLNLSGSGGDASALERPPLQAFALIHESKSARVAPTGSPMYVTTLRMHYRLPAGKVHSVRRKTGYVATAALQYPVLPLRSHCFSGSRPKACTRGRNAGPR